MSDPNANGPLRVLVTGGTRGIGRAVALHFARHGAKVAIAARTSSELDDVVREIEAAGGEGEACQANLRDHGSLEAAVFRAVDFFDGTTDVLVHCAGQVEYGSFEELAIADWERNLDVQMMGPVLVLAEALPSLRESDRAHVFLIGAASADEPAAGEIVMATTKAGIAGLGRALRADLASDSLRVTTVTPGPIDTPGLSKWKDRFDASSLGSAEDVASAIWDAYHADHAPDVLPVVKDPS